MTHRHDGIDSDVADLYEIVEVQKLHAVPAAVAADALRLINPDLTSDEIAALIREHDGMGNGTIRQNELHAIVQKAIRSIDLAEASKMLRDLVFRMRVAFRRRYLMYETSPNVPPEFLLENITTANHYRLLFDTVAHGADWISRPQLRELLTRILPDNKAAVGTACKAAMGPGDRANSIGFAEFAMVVHPITQQIPLSTLVERATASASSASSSKRPGAWLEEIKEKQLGGGGRDDVSRSSRSGQNTPTPNATLSTIKAEMPSYRLESEAAAMRINEAIQYTANNNSIAGGGGSTAKYAVRNAPSMMTSLSMSPARGLSMGTVDSAFFPNSPQHQHQSADPSASAVRSSASIIPTAADTARAVDEAMLRDRDETIHKLQEELAKSQLEVTSLTRELHTIKINSAAVNHRDDRHKMLSSKTHATEGGNDERALLDDPFYRINQLEKELKEAKVKLGIASDSKDLYNLLLRTGTTKPLARFYTDEKPLLAKHEYLRKISDLIDPQSPQMVLLTQYELLVCSYQALFRQASDKARSASNADGGAASSSSFSCGRSPSVAGGGASSSARNRSPSAGGNRAGSRGNSTSASVHTPLRHAMPFKWSEVDQPVSHEHWKTRTLGDPTLTEEERNLLRQRLARQMRTAARSKSPHLKSKANSFTSARGASAGRSSSQGGSGGGDNRSLSARKQMLTNDDGVKANLTSQETMQRLQALSQFAAKQKFL